MDWDNKKDWVSRRKELYMRLMQSPHIPEMNKRRVFYYPKGLWETPKTFVDGYAYNDGTWLIYNTFRMKGGKVRNKIYCKTKQDVIKQLYSYCCFLKTIGIDNAMEMYYYVTCHIIYKLAFQKGIWDCYVVNTDKMENLVKTVSSKDVTCARKDPRKYCFDPETKEGKTKSQVIGLQRKKDKEQRWKRIEELYDERLTIPQNLDKFKDNGLDISKRTLQRWKREQRGDKWFLMTQKSPKNNQNVKNNTIDYQTVKGCQMVQ